MKPSSQKYLAGYLLSLLTKQIKSRSAVIFEIFKGLYKFIADSQSQYMHANVLVDDKSKHKQFHLEAVNRMINSLSLSGEQAIHVSSIAPLAIEKVIDFSTNMILNPEP